MKAFYHVVLPTSLWLLSLLTPCLAQTYTAQELQEKTKQAAAAARKHLTDSLASVAKQQQANAKTVQEAVTAALAAEAASQNVEAQIGTVSLVPAVRYPLFSGSPATTRDFGKFFKLKEMNFYLENGRLLRVYAVGELGIDSLYKQRQPAPGAAATARQEAKAAEKARAQAKLASAEVTKAQKALTNNKNKKLTVQLERALKQRQADAGLDNTLAIGAEARAKTAAQDSLTQNVPLSTPDGDRIVTLHKYRILRPIRFTNGSVAIDLNRPADSKIIDVLYPDEYQTGEPVLGLRFLDLVSIVHSSGRRLITDNATWTLKPGGTEATYRLTAGASLGGLLEVALYTDLLATLNNEDNSLVTTEVSSFLPLNQRPLWANGNFVAFTAVRPFLTLARLDSKFDTLRLRGVNTVDRPDLLQRSYLRFGLNMNLLTFDNRRHVTYSLNGSWTRTLSRVAGSQGLDTTRIRNVYQNLYGVELLANVRRQRNFGADIYFTAYLHNVQSRRPIENTGAQWALRPGALFYYYPFGSPNNKLFFRVSNFIFPKGRQRDFVQLQVGYSIGIGTLLQGQTTTAEAGSGGSNTSTHLPSTQ